MSEISSKRVMSNLGWKLVERFGAHGVTLIVSIILARLLDPAVYGTISIITVFTSILSVFLDSGFSSALIQKKNSDDCDFSTVFYFQLVFSIFLYLGLYFCAPVISNYYELGNLIPYIRVMSLTLIISALKSVQVAYVSKNLLFKRFFYSTLGGTITSAILGIWMAMNGFGVWALIAQNLTSALIDTIILWLTVPWRPKLAFSFARLKELLSFGWKLLVSSLVDTIYNNVRSLIIGKKYTSEDLAFYNKGKVFPNLIVTNVNSSINAVLFPVMSGVQENTESVKRITRRAIKTSTFILFPLMTGLAVCAEPLIKLLLTEKWLPCAMYLRIFCFTYAFYPIHTANLNAIKALGRSDLFLKLEVIKKIVGVAAVLSTMFISVEAMAYSLIAVSILSQIINSWPNKKILKYGYHEQLKDMLPSICLSAVMCLFIFPIKLIAIGEFFQLLISVVVGAVVYISAAAILKLDCYLYLWNIIKTAIKKRVRRNKGDNDL